MTDTPSPTPDGVSASAAERLAALRQPSKQRGRPAHASKILAAGLSTTALFGMVTVMGWPADTGIAQNTAPSPTAPVPPAPTIVVPATTVAAVVPGATLPTSASTTTVPAVIPVATPVAVPVQVSAQPSNTTTKSSG